MTREAFVKLYQDQIAGELTLAVRSILAKFPNDMLLAATIGHWMIDNIRRSAEIAGVMYDSLAVPALNGQPKAEVKK
jgi:hypothetical protein